jgi:hypothetical protein
MLPSLLQLCLFAFCFGYYRSYDGRAFKDPIAILKMTFLSHILFREISLVYGPGFANTQQSWFGSDVLQSYLFVSFQETRTSNQILAYCGFQVSVCFFFCKVRNLFLCIHAIQFAQTRKTPLTLTLRETHLMLTWLCWRPEGFLYVCM